MKHKDLDIDFECDECFDPFSETYSKPCTKKCPYYLDRLEHIQKTKPPKGKTRHSESEEKVKEYKTKARLKNENKYNYI
jgi:hypothetical protein